MYVNHFTLWKHKFQTIAVKISLSWNASLELWNRLSIFPLDFLMKHLSHPLFISLFICSNQFYHQLLCHLVYHNFLARIRLRSFHQLYFSAIVVNDVSRQTTAYKPARRTWCRINSRSIKKFLSARHVLNGSQPHLGIKINTRW